MLREKYGDSEDSGEVDGWVGGRRYGMEQAFRRLERGISIFWVGGMMRDGREGVIFVGDLSETARDVSSIGETRRGREGESWNVGFGFEVTRG